MLELLKCYNTKWGLLQEVSFACFSHQFYFPLTFSKKRATSQAIVPVIPPQWTWHYEDHPNENCTSPSIPRAHTRSPECTPQAVGTNMVLSCTVFQYQDHRAYTYFIFWFTFHLMFYILGLDKVKGTKICGDLCSPLSWTLEFCQ